MADPLGSVEALIRKHQHFEEPLAAQEEIFAQAALAPHAGSVQVNRRNLAKNSWFENADKDLTDPVRCNSIEEICALQEAQFQDSILFFCNGNLFDYCIHLTVP